MMRVRDLVLVSFMLFWVGAVGDNLFTWWFVRVCGVFHEANPFARVRVYSAPLWGWFMLDAAGFMVSVFAAIAVYRLFLWVGLRVGGSWREAWMRLAAMSWVVVMVSAIVRLYPFIHNVILLLGG